MRAVADMVHIGISIVNPIDVTKASESNGFAGRIGPGLGACMQAFEAQRPARRGQ
jgi:hypothetical protein